jgi:hypothetical protein
LADKLIDTSDESKEHSKKVLEELGGEKAFYGKEDAVDQKGDK